MNPFKKQTLAKAVGLALTASALVTIAVPASATLLLRSAFQDAALSIDGFGSTTNSGTLQVDTPSGAQVLKAYLYAASVWSFSGLSNVSLAGNLLTTASGSLLTPNANPADTMVWDVTSIMEPLIEGKNGLQSFDYSESGDMDGGVLVVVYKDSSTVGGTAIILDGELALAGDSTTLTFAAPYTSGDIIMSLASSFSFQPGAQVAQVTIVNVVTRSTASRRLTSCAGGQDDGAGANGALITVGGIGDSPTNPDPACTRSNGPTANDDELYNLALGNSASATPFVQTGDTFVTLNTLNPSFDDNVFFLGFTTAFTISKVNGDPINGIPEPGMLGLLGMGLLGLYGARRRKTA